MVFGMGIIWNGEMRPNKIVPNFAVALKGRGRLLRRRGSGSRWVVEALQCGT